MSIRKIALVAALGVSLASAPVVAQTASQPVRAGATLDQASQVDEDRDGTARYVIAFFAVVAIGLGLYFAFFDDKNDAPRSP